MFFGMNFFNNTYEETIFWDVHTHQSITHQKDEVKIFNIFPNQKLNINSFANSSQSEVYFSVGLHPWHIQSDWQSEFQNVFEIAQMPHCVAIGECGLDRAIQTPFEIQLEIFVEHIQLSESIQKPLIIHCVRAYPDIISIYKKFKIKQKWILHGFNGNQIISKQLLNYTHIKLSFGKGLWMSKIQEVFRELPLEKCLFETDDATLTIQEVYQKASMIRNIPLEKLKESIQRNISESFVNSKQNSNEHT
jgi:TatD DNase family protein